MLGYAVVCMLIFRRFPRRKLIVKGIPGKSERARGKKVSRIVRSIKDPLVYFQLGIQADGDSG